MSAGMVTGGQINAVLQLVRKMTENGDEQLSIIARAFVTGCRSCSVEPTVAMATIAEIFAEDYFPLVPLEQEKR